MSKCVYPKCSCDTSLLTVRGRSPLHLKYPAGVLLWVKILRSKCDTEIPFLPGCEWRWPPVSCRPQHEPRVYKRANPLLPAFLQVSSAHLPVPRSPAAHAHRSPGLCFPLPVGEGSPWGCSPCPSPLRHLTPVHPSLGIGQWVCAFLKNVTT